MKKILIGKSIAYGAKFGGGTIASINELATLDTGAFAVFTESNQLVTVANATTVLPNSKTIKIAVGNQATPSKSVLTVEIPRLNTNFIPRTYVAPTKVVKFIGNDGTIGALNLPATLVAGTEAFIKITNTSLGLRTIGTVYGNEIKRYSTVVLIGDTVTAIVTRLINLINNDPDSIVTAVVVGVSAGIQLSAKDFGVMFDIALSGIMVGSTIEEPEGTTPGNSVALVYGEGTDTQIGTLEDLYSVERGNTNRINLPQFYYNVTSLITPGATYETKTISFAGRRTTSLVSQDTHFFEIVLALITGSAQLTTLNTIFAEVFGGAESTSNIEPGN